MNDAKRLAFVLLALAISLGFFVVLLEAQLSAVVKFVLGSLTLAACGMAISKAYHLESWGGLFLFRSQKGLAFLDKLAKRYPKRFQQLAEIGMVVGYGSFAYFLMRKKKLEWKSTLATYSIGTFFLVLMSALLPLAMVMLLSMVRGGEEFASAGSKFQEATSGAGLLKALSIAFLVLGGITLVTTMSIVTYALIVGSAILTALLGNSSVLAATPPGGMPLLPGINLDLVQGLAALVVVLVVHEGMHGILARLHKLPLKSAGVVFFGFLPFGAFVDIDEKKLFSEKKEKQNAVLVAGTTANFATALFFLGLFYLLLSVMGDAPSEQVKYLGRFLALTFSLNLIVASVNLVPLPMFDGYHIMKNGVPHPLAQKAITYLVGLCFLLTLAPWLLR